MSTATMNPTAGKPLVGPLDWTCEYEISGIQLPVAPGIYVGEFDGTAELFNDGGRIIVASIVLVATTRVARVRGGARWPSEAKLVLSPDSDDPFLLAMFEKLAEELETNWQDEMADAWTEARR